jgi:hypothetical protein
VTFVTSNAEASARPVGNPPDAIAATKKRRHCLNMSRKIPGVSHFNVNGAHRRPPHLDAIRSG